MGKVEEVKKILDQHYGESYGKSPDGMGNLYISKCICQLFESKSALPLTQALIDIKEEEHRSEDSPMHLDTDGQWKVKPDRLLTEQNIIQICKGVDIPKDIKVPMSVLPAFIEVAKAQLAKDIEWEAKTTSIKESEFEKKCKDCEYDPQAAEFGWFLRQGWLPPEEVKKKDAEWRQILRDTIIMKDAECQARAMGTIRDLLTILKDTGDTRTHERALVDYVKTLIEIDKE